MNLDKVEAVLLGQNGGAVIVAPRGDRQYRISVPREAIAHQERRSRANMVELMLRSAIERHGAHRNGGA